MLFQTRGNGNCLFHAMLGCLKIRTSSDKDSPYFPCRYMRRMVVAYMCHHRDFIWKHKEAALRGRYGVEGGDDCPDPISYREYLKRMLKRGTWGDDICIHAFACIAEIRITVFNTNRLEEYRVRHNLTLDKVDAVLVYNGRNHYSYAGE